ncbi:hypothetical protein P8452_10164 [Trifolium repens]|nr:hypothetical protein P8452_10164 [Trifolium repens]
MENNSNEQPLPVVVEMVNGTSPEPVNLVRAINDLSHAVNKALEEIATFVVAQYSTHFEEIKTILEVKKAVTDLGDIKTLVVETCSSKLEEMKAIVLGQQKSIDNIHGSLKLIEVVMCNKTGVDNPIEADLAVDGQNDKDPEHVVNVSNGKRKFVDNKYESELEKEKELNLLDLTFTDEEDDDQLNTLFQEPITQTASRFNLINKPSTPKPVLPDAWTNNDTMRNTADISNRVQQAIIEELKIPTQGKKGASSSRGKKTMTTSTAKKTRMVLPRGIKWNFPVTVDMQLDLSELQALAYVYHPDKDKQKRLVSSKGIEAFRYDFDTIRPGAKINKKIMTLVCVRAMWVQENYKRGAVWFLPPAFADDISSGVPINQLIDRYCKDWMPPYPRLKYIYVPINTANGHWFLMVLSVQLGVVYHLDSHCRMEEVSARRATMSDICQHLHEMVASPFYGTTFFDRNVLIGDWPIEEARGIPNCGHSNNVVVWLMDLIDMHQCFTPNLQGELKENMVRAKTAALLVIGLQNDMWTFIEDEAKEFWELITA